MKKNLGVSLIMLSSLLSLPVADLQAAQPSNAEMYKMLLEMKKELAETRAENQELKKAIQKMPQATAATAKAVDDFDETQALRDKPVAMKGQVKDSYLTFESADGNIQYKLDGRLMIDAGAVSGYNDSTGKNNLRTNTELRRARLGLKVKHHDWSGEFDVDVAGSGADTGHVEAKDMFVAYNGFPNTTLKIGNHKPNFSMDEVTTSRWSTFLETAMITEFAPGRRVGFSANHWQESFLIGATLFGDEYFTEPTDQGTATIENKRSERLGFAVRGAYRPVVQDNGGTILHLGGNYMNYQPQSDDTNNGRAKFSARPEAHFLDYKFLNTGNMNNVKDIDTWGLEVAGKWKKFLGQAEYMSTKVHRNTGTNPEFDGWYVMGSYFLTDDQRPYNLEDGEFGPVKPNGKWGAWEVAARYSNLDLNDVGAGITGGEADNVTLGLNWYINNNYIVKANYIHVNNDDKATGSSATKYTGGDDLNIMGARFEYLF